MTLLHEVLASSEADQSAFQNAAGISSFVTAVSASVLNNAEFPVASLLCDKILNFFASLRARIFAYLKAHPEKILAGDTAPTCEWDPAVTHYIQHLLTQSGGLSSFETSSANNTITVASAEEAVEYFNELIASTLFGKWSGKGLRADLEPFVTKLAASVQSCWSDQTQPYRVLVQSQVHVPVSAPKAARGLLYIPTVGSLDIALESVIENDPVTPPTPMVAATPEKTWTITYRYQLEISALKASVLSPVSSDYLNFLAFLDKAQAISYRAAANTAQIVLDDSAAADSASPKADTTMDAVLLKASRSAYPAASLPVQRNLRIERILNDRSGW